MMGDSAMGKSELALGLIYHRNDILQLQGLDSTRESIDRKIKFLRDQTNATNID